MEQKFEAWCLVELFGHARIAGRCTEESIAGTTMLRVDVPVTASQPAFTRFLGSAAIYAINPIDEKTALYMAERLQVKPIEAWDVNAVMKKYNEALLLKGAASPSEDGAEDEEEEV
jgi:hypothetical protein